MTVTPLRTKLPKRPIDFLDDVDDVDDLLQIVSYHPWVVVQGLY